MHGLTAQYISELVVKKQPNRVLRYNKGIILQQVKVKTNFGRHSFSIAAPSLWNMTLDRYQS